MPRYYPGIFALALTLACNDNDPMLTGGVTPPPGSLTGFCFGNNQCNGTLVCNGGYCVDVGGGSSPSDPSGVDPTEGSSDTVGTTDIAPTSGDPTGSPTSDPTVGPTSDPTVGPTSDPTVGPTSDPTSESESNSDPSTSGPPPDNCMHLQLDPDPTTVIFVVDRSGSQTAVKWDHDANPNTATVTRWSSVHKALTAAVNKYAGQDELGLMMFPSSAATASYTEAACVTNPSPEVAPKAGNAAAINGALPPANMTLAGGTPMARGINGALAGLAGVPSNKSPAMVLLGDGPPNCSIGAPSPVVLFETLDSDPISLVEEAWVFDKIPTVVVGVDISNVTSPAQNDGNPDNANPYSYFNELAVAGGRPRAGADKFYSAHSESELVTFVDQAVSSVLGCNLSLGSAPGVPSATVVTVNGSSYPYNPNLDCASGNGWIYTGNNSTLQLCGTACSGLKSAGSALVDVDCG